MIMTGMGKKRRAVYISSESEDSNTDSEVEGSKISKKCGVISISSIKNITSSSEKGENMNATKTRLCENLLRKLMSHKDGWLFNRPVDPVVLRIPDYFDIIHNPMDLGTVKKKLASKQYMSTHEFAADVRLTFSNAMRYNPPGNDVHVIAKHLNNIFNLEWKLLERKWGKGNLVPEEHPMKITKVQAAVTSKPAIPKRLTVCSGSTGRNFITNAKSSKSAQVIRKFASRGSEQASAKDMLFQVVAGGEGCLQHPLSCTKEYAKVSRVQVGEQSSGLNGKGSQSYCDSSTSPIASSEQGEENSLHDEPLSPSKALRAAMLRSRFAGTIVKAQQKALLDHGKKIDPGKLQLEKEKLERRQQEEKARIEAQVKAAEAAAQLQIETEMRMKREREREAARLALQMMKKTVDIDNTDFVKDVENLSKRCRLNTPGKLIVDFVNGIEQPPDLRSPLEQLGLFIKKDLEEEVESEWEDCISPTVNADVEEGEIG